MRLSHGPRTRQTRPGGHVGRSVRIVGRIGINMVRLLGFELRAYGSGAYGSRAYGLKVCRDVFFLLRDPFAEAKLIHGQTTALVALQSLLPVQILIQTTRRPTHTISPWNNKLHAPSLACPTSMDEMDEYAIENFSTLNIRRTTARQRITTLGISIVRGSRPYKISLPYPPHPL